MQAFTQLQGVVAPLDQANIDTDQIIPKQFLKSIKRTGFGVNLFDEWRYLDEGFPGQDHSKRPKNPAFVLNKPVYSNAKILLTRDNFGCGSSREHAPWALEDFGIRCVIAPSFADIFYNNCFKNGILPITLTHEQVDVLFAFTEQQPGLELSIDLERKQIVSISTNVEYKQAFDIDPSRQETLLKGLDDIGLSLQYKEQIKAFEAKHLKANPWVNAPHQKA